MPRDPSTNVKCLVVQSADCSGFTIYDASEIVMPYESVVAAVIEVSNPGTITPVVINVPSASLADLQDPTIGFLITAAMLGLGTVLPDNVYYVKYTLTLADGTFVTTDFTYTDTELFMCAINCCMRKKRLQLPPPYSQCEEYDMLELAEGTLLGLTYAACCGNDSYILKALAWLQDFCSNCLGSNPATVISSGCGCSGSGTPTPTPMNTPQN